MPGRTVFCGHDRRGHVAFQVKCISGNWELTVTGIDWEGAEGLHSREGRRMFQQEVSTLGMV